MTARRALSADMSRVAWLRTELDRLEDQRRDRLTKAVLLAIIAKVFMVIVLQNAEPVDVDFLFFSFNIRIIWVIVGSALLGGVAGYILGRPEKSLPALMPQQDDEPAEPARAAGR